MFSLRHQLGDLNRRIHDVGGEFLTKGDNPLVLVPTNNNELTNHMIRCNRTLPRKGNGNMSAKYKNYNKVTVVINIQQSPLKFLFD